MVQIAYLVGQTLTDDKQTGFGFTTVCPNEGILPDVDLPIWIESHVRVRVRARLLPSKLDICTAVRYRRWRGLFWNFQSESFAGQDFLIGSSAHRSLWVNRWTLNLSWTESKEKLAPKTSRLALVLPSRSATIQERIVLVREAGQQAKIIIISQDH